MELLNISLTCDSGGRVDLDTVIGGDVSYQPYPGPDYMELLRAVSALVVSWQCDPHLMVDSHPQALLALPALLQSLSEGVQKLISASPKLGPQQLALFS